MYHTLLLIWLPLSVVLRESCNVVRCPTGIRTIRTRNPRAKLPRASRFLLSVPVANSSRLESHAQAVSNTVAKLAYTRCSLPCASIAARDSVPCVHCVPCALDPCTRFVRHNRVHGSWTTHSKGRSSKHWNM